MQKKALIFWGEWRGHQPERVCAHFERMLKKRGLPGGQRALPGPSCGFCKASAIRPNRSHYMMNKP